MNDKYIKINSVIWKILRLEAAKKDKTIKALATEYLTQGLKRSKKVKKLF